MRPAPNGASCPLSSSSAIPPSHRRRVGVPSPPRTARGGKVATTAADAQVGRQGLFVRNATGLVRELTAFDAFNLVFSAVLIPVGITQVMGFAPQFWPHANMLVSFLIATPLVACFGLVYLYFTVLMPRSGGDYVWVSRTLHPFLGFLVNFSLTFVFLTWVAFNFTFMLSVMGPAAAYVAGIENHYFTSPSNAELMLVATVLTAAFAALMIVGVRSVARYMAITFGLVWIGMIAWLVAMLVGSHDHFVKEWNTQSGMTYDGVISQANQLGLIYKYFGFKFFGSAVFMGLGDGSDKWTGSFSPYLPAMANFLPGPHFIEIAVAAAFVLAILW